MPKNPFKNKVSQTEQSIADGLKQGDPVFWHRIIMSVVIALIGLILICGILLDFLADRQVDRLLSQPLVQYSQTALPQGEYAIYQVYLDTGLHKHYLVSSTNGGAIVSVAAPEGTQEPKDIVAAEHYDAAAYVLTVDADKAWTFVPTTVYDQLQKKLAQPPVTEQQVTESVQEQSSQAGSESQAEAESQP